MGVRETANKLPAQGAESVAPGAPRTRLGDGASLVVPEAVMDGLVEVVWSDPTTRVAFARVLPPRRIRFMAWAGPEESKELTGEELNLALSRGLHDSLRSAESPLIIEDVRTDFRTKPLAEHLEALGIRSLLLHPVRASKQGEPIGVITIDSSKPRTWGAKDAAQFERLQPLVALALENSSLREHLDRGESEIAEYERRMGAVRGVVDGVVHDTNILVGALLSEVASSGAASTAENATALGRALEGVLGELQLLEPGGARLEEPVDLNRLVHELAPALRGLIGPDITLLTQLHPEPARVSAYRTGLERLILNLLAHMRGAPRSGNSVVLETVADATHVSVLIYGSALTNDSALPALANQNPLGDGELPTGLWLARCELLLHGAKFELVGEEGGQPRVKISLQRI